MGTLWQMWESSLCVAVNGYFYGAQLKAGHSDLFDNYCLYTLWVTGGCGQREKFQLLQLVAVCSSKCLYCNVLCVSVFLFFSKPQKSNSSDHNRCHYSPCLNPAHFSPCDTTVEQAQYQDAPQSTLPFPVKLLQYVPMCLYWISELPPSTSKHLSDHKKG